MHAGLVLHGQNPGDGGPLPVDLHLVIKGEPAAVPALAQIDRQDGPVPYHLRHVIGLTMEIPGIKGEARRQKGVANLDAIQFGLIDTQGGNGQCRLFDLSGGNCLPEHLHNAFLIGTLRGDKMVVQFHVILSCSDMPH